MPENIMGRSLLTLSEAAQLLDVTPQTVGRLIRDGIFTPKYEKQERSSVPKPFLRKEDVEAFAESRQEGATPQKTRLLAQQALAQNRSLERRLLFLENAIGASLAPPSLEPDKVTALFVEADEDLDSVPTSAERILYWARFFLGVGEEFFDVLTSVTENEDSWQVFQDLSQVIAENAPRELFEANQDLRAAFSYFEVGRRNFRAALFFHLRVRLGLRSAAKAIGEVDDIHEEIISFANAELNAKTHP